eukprot:EG_transcript_10143
MPPLQTSLSSFFHKAAEKVTAFKALGEVTAEPGERPPPTPATGSADNAVTFQGGGSHEAPRHVIGLWDGYARAVFGPQPDGPKPPAVGEAFWAVYVAECPGSPDEYACCAGRVLSNPSQRWGDLFEFQYDGPDGGPPIWVPRHWLFRGQQRAEAVVRGLNAKLERQRREAAERRRPAKSVTAKHPPAQRERRPPGPRTLPRPPGTTRQPSDSAPLPAAPLPRPATRASFRRTAPRRPRRPPPPRMPRVPWRRWMPRRRKPRAMAHRRALAPGRTQRRRMTGMRTTRCTTAPSIPNRLNSPSSPSSLTIRSSPPQRDQRS